MNERRKSTRRNRTSAASNVSSYKLMIPRVGPFAGLAATSINAVGTRTVNVISPVFFEDATERNPLLYKKLHITGGIQLYASQEGSCGQSPTGAVFINCHEFSLTAELNCTGGALIADGLAGNSGSAPGCDCAFGGSAGNGASGGGGGGLCGGVGGGTATGGDGGTGTDGSDGGRTGSGCLPAGSGGVATQNGVYGAPYLYAYGNGNDGASGGTDCCTLAPGVGGASGNGYGGGGGGGSAMVGCSQSAGGGGGGAGGLLVVVANIFSSDSIGLCRLSALGGGGGNGDGGGTEGGAGGDGVIWAAFRRKRIGSPMIGVGLSKLYAILPDNSLVLKNWSDTWDYL